MHKAELTYEDIDGNEVTRTFYFHINEADWLRFNFSEKEGIEARMRQYIKDNDAGKVFKLFEDLIEMSYGVRNEQEKTFEKDDAVTKKFMQSDAYSALLTKLLSDAEAANKFVLECLPKKYQERMPADAPTPQLLDVPVETVHLPKEPTVPTPELSPLGIPQNNRVGEPDVNIMNERNPAMMSREELIAALQNRL